MFQGKFLKSISLNETFLMEIYKLNPLNEILGIKSFK